jgi:hypothetical protein
MRLIAIVSSYEQVSQSEYRDFNYSHEFNEQNTIQDMLDWAKRQDPRNDFFSMRFSVLDEKDALKNE